MLLDACLNWETTADIHKEVYRKLCHSYSPLARLLLLFLFLPNRKMIKGCERYWSQGYPLINNERRSRSAVL